MNSKNKLSSKHAYFLPDLAEVGVPIFMAFSVMLYTTSSKLCPANNMLPVTDTIY